MVNLYLGINKDEPTWQKTASDVEAQLDEMGEYTCNEGSDENVHNINVTFDDHEKAYAFENSICKTVDYTETETL